MQINSQQQQILKQLPGVDRLLVLSQGNDELRAAPKSVLLRSIRDTLEALRRGILDPDSQIDAQRDLDETKLLSRIIQRVSLLQAKKLQRTINATGVVVHTNLGRSCLAAEAVDHMIAAARCYTNLEFDLKTGKRGSRYAIVESLLCEISGAQSAMVVNNNAGAVLLCLDTLAKGREVVLSRGELVEIGGSFRIPDVMAKSGALLKEVGTTNRTHPRDYEGAIGDDTGLLLKVHTSNYSIIGFTASVSLTELVKIGGKFNLPVMEDLGSGNFIDLSRYGLPGEPTVQESVVAGIDVITFSGDKLLGGPQAGIIVGKKELLDRIKTNPLTRALRIDKMTLAALEATLQLYRDEIQALNRIPTLRMLSTPLAELESRARQLSEALSVYKSQGLTTSLHNLSSRAGGGSLPMRPLPSCCVGVSIAGLSPNAIEKSLRGQRPAVIGRIENDIFMLDPRTLLEDEIDLVAAAFKIVIETLPKEKC